MQYEQVVKGVFRERPNRFVALVEIDGILETVHVKNTGRCRELLLSGCTVYLALANNPNRKTKYDLIAVEKKRERGTSLLINMDSQMPNAAAEEWLRKGTLFSQNAVIRREVRFGNSRFDFFVEDCGMQAFLEVKGVTLEENGLALFPDAPTERGVKHIRELVTCLKSGYAAYLLFVVQMQGMNAFRPNDRMHSEFGEALRMAKQAGVTILAMDCLVTPDAMTLHQPVPVLL